MNSKKAELVSKKVFDEIFGKKTFEVLDSRLDHEWARWARYQYYNKDIEKQLNVILDDSFIMDIEIAFGKSQGYNMDTIIKKNIEFYAMEKAKKHFVSIGYNVMDHSKQKPYDYYCKREEEELFIEVKGTQSTGEQIILTRNEVDFVKTKPGKMVLFIVSEIIVNKETKKVSSGKVNEINPWNIEDGKLLPMAYNYCLK